MMPEELDADYLYLFVFGPGKGESIAIRVPPDLWVIVDSCRVAGKAAAMHVLPKYGGQCECIVLTHRHQDHYAGFSNLLDYDVWRLVGCNDLYLDGHLGESRDLERRLANELEQVFASVEQRWAEDVESVWWTWRKTARQVGHAELIALHPEESYARDFTGYDRNELSSAILLTWQRVKLLLGADVPNPHWAEICEVFADQRLNVHQAMKAPHHGSEEALDDGILQGDPDRFWFITPYSPKRVPRFEDGRGIHRMLQHVNALHLTGLPRAHDRQMEQPCKAFRRELAAGQDPVATSFSLPGGIEGDLEPVRDDLSCYLVARFDEHGKGEVVGYGPGSVLVREGP